ncbi:MAG: sugar ABC transporter permease [Spirochaetales bacterium]|nr:sugar ABC transporter permease [Spirochaetales bacterium]
MIEKNIWQKIWQKRLMYLFISPFFLLFIVFQFFPLIYSMILSLYKWNGLGAREYVGFKNYINLFSDQMFLECLENTFFYWALSILMIIPVALIIAAVTFVISSKRIKTYQTILFLPYVSAAVSIGLVFYILFDHNAGFVNNILAAIGFERIPWLVSTKVSKFPVLFLVSWRAIPWYMLIFYSGLQSINRDLFEAAKIDGANPIQNLMNIIIPTIAPLAFFCLINLSIESFRRFAEPQILTGGGPGSSSMTLVQYLYINGFTIFKLGYASAIGYVLTFILIIVSSFQLRIMIKRSKEGV